MQLDGEGRSADAYSFDADQAGQAAAGAGVRCVTHLFNAMSQLGNREPGVVGGALRTGNLSAGLIADLIHKNSVRCKHPLIKINCGSIPESLIEAELFGAEAGAFTDAKSTRIGRFEAAGDGTEEKP